MLFRHTGVYVDQIMQIKRTIAVQFNVRSVNGTFPPYTLVWCMTSKKTQLCEGVQTSPYSRFIPVDEPAWVLRRPNAVQPTWTAWALRSWPSLDSSSFGRGRCTVTVQANPCQTHVGPCRSSSVPLHEVQPMIKLRRHYAGIVRANLACITSRNPH